MSDTPAVPIKVTLVRAAELCQKMDQFMHRYPDAMGPPGRHPMSVVTGLELAMLVRDLAAYVDQHGHL